MSAPDCFKVAAQAEGFSVWVFWGMTAASGALLLFPGSRVEAVVSPMLVVGAVAGIVAGVIIMIYQNRGNRLQRAVQLTNALEVPLGGEVPEGYYNNSLPPSIAKLAATTLENTLFTSEVLAGMLRKERCAVAMYTVLFLFLLAYRGTSLGWVVFLAQTLFSADVVMNWLRMERYHHRTVAVHERLQQLFLQGGVGRKPVGIALTLAAFGDYECAKDEAAMPLDSDIFRRVNPLVSEKWESMKRALKIN